MLQTVLSRALTLQHRAFYIGLANQGNVIVAADRQGNATVIVPPDFVPTPISLPEVRHLALSPDGARLLLITEAGVELRALHDADRRVSVAGEFTACDYSADGEFICTTERMDEETIRVAIRDARTLRDVYSADVDDPFGGSDCSIFRHPLERHFAIWIAAGQDGQTVITVSYGDRLDVAPLNDVFDVAPPVFSPDGSLILLITESQELRRYSFPEGELVSNFTWPTRDDTLDTYAAYVGHDSALVLSNLGRLYLVDLAGGALVSEIAVPGHSPRPIREIYPPLTDTALGSDVSYVHACGAGVFVSRHRTLPASDSEWRDRIAIWTLPALTSAA